MGRGTARSYPDAGGLTHRRRLVMFDDVRARVFSRTSFLPDPKEWIMARDSGSSIGGIGIGGILVILGIVLAFVWSVWIGILVAVVGLVAFGGFARGRWY